MQSGSGRSRVLLVEDEPDVAHLVRHALERTGDFQVNTVDAGDAALKAATETGPDLIILDLNLPILDGMEVFRLLRSRTHTSAIPIVILTARAGEDDRVTGLELGADDYVTKPFSLRELVARVRTVLRRSHRRAEPTGAAPAPARFQGRHLVADFDAVSIQVDGEPVRLTRREFELLRFLVANRNRVLSRERLLERVWGYDREMETRSVDVHVGRLRAKLGAVGRQIETIVGLGYRFVE
jgi:DNA-binding response OmpR family regulator